MQGVIETTGEAGGSIADAASGTTWIPATVGTAEMSDVSHSDGFGGFHHEVVAETIQEIVDSMVSRQPFDPGVQSQSHVMWIARMTSRMLTRDAELMKREICVARREAALASREN